MRAHWLAISLVFFVVPAAWPAVQPSSKTRLTASSGATSASRLNPAFSIQRLEPCWSFLSPEGKAFFSFGVCCVHQGTASNEFDPENPSYAAWQHHENKSSW